MHNHKTLFTLVTISFALHVACQPEPSTPEDADPPEVILLDEDMTSSSDATMDEPADQGGGLSCSEDEVELTAARDVGGVSLPAGCYASCATSQDCEDPNPKCYDAFAQPICVPDTIPSPGPECGDGVIEGDEVCDGDCITDAAECPAPQEQCMQAVIAGSSQTCDAACAEAPVDVCKDDDGCCPSSCSPDDDSDCMVWRPDTGAACSYDRDCIGDVSYIGQYCIDHRSWTDGYCTSECGTDEDCGGDGVCLPARQGGMLCFDRCSFPQDCRDGYICSAAGSGRVCIPNSGSGVTQAGQACESNADCGQGEFCQNEDDGYPGGFCFKPCRTTTQDCDPGTRCVAENVPAGETPLGFCSPACSNDAQCRDGYGCLVGGACWPMASGTGEAGSACISRSGCAGGGLGECFTPLYGFQDGYCSSRCQSDADCGQGAHCGTGFGAATCVASCQTDEECPRAGYVCTDHDNDGQRECLPGGDGDGDVGDPCVNVGECAGGATALCINALGFDTAWTAGYCSVQCSPEAPCPQGSNCSTVGDDAPYSVCLESCQNSSECRADYACLDIDQNGTRECSPRPSVSF